jgi:hypothetical protein
MKTIDVLILTLPVKSFAFFALILMIQFTACGERTEEVDSVVEEEVIEDDITVDEIVMLNAALEGGDTGDPEGTGSASISIDPEAEEVCFEIEVSGIDEPTMAHIHRGAEGETGGVVVDFNLPQHGMNGCVTGVNAGVIEEIIENPRNFYVNVHNNDYPGGAVRGQLVLP